MSLYVKNTSSAPVTLAAGVYRKTLAPGEIFDCTGCFNTNAPADWAALEAQRASAGLLYAWNGPAMYSTHGLQLDYSLVVPVATQTKTGIMLDDLVGGGGDVL